MKLTEAQNTIMESVVQSIAEGGDGHELIKQIQRLQEQGIDVYDYLEKHQPEILMEDDE